jgi:quinol-cytochrome oxidoreductase complex cytochrome b subunit
VLVLLVPFIDRTPGPGDLRSRLIAIAALVVLAIAGVLTVLVYMPAGGGPS